MQFTSIISVLALAMTAAALPAAENIDLLAPRTNNPAPACTNNDQRPVCCTGLFGILGCAVNILGGPCQGSSYCCSTTAAPVSRLFIELTHLEQHADLASSSRARSSTSSSSTALTSAKRRTAHELSGGLTAGVRGVVTSWAGRNNDW